MKGVLPYPHAVCARWRRRRGRTVCLNMPRNCTVATDICGTPTEFLDMTKGLALKTAPYRGIVTEPTGLPFNKNRSASSSPPGTPPPPSGPWGPLLVLY